MRWYYYQKECEFCEEEFEASRQDARFCSGRCRTAHSRREKRREQAAKSLTTVWDAYTQAAYHTLLDEVPDAGTAIKDIYIDHSPEAAAAAVKLAHQVTADIIQRMEQRINRKQETIDRLHEDKQLLNHIKELLQV